MCNAICILSESFSSLIEINIKRECPLSNPFDRA